MVAEIETKVMEFEPIPLDGITEWNFTDIHDRQSRSIFLLVFRNGIIKRLYLQNCRNIA